MKDEIIEQLNKLIHLGVQINANQGRLDEVKDQANKANRIDRSLTGVI